MKTIKNIGLIILFTLVLFACKKDEVLPYKMTATVGGEEWKTRAPIGVQKDNTFTIQGTSLEGKIIILTIFGTEVKTYNLNPESLQAQCSILYKESASTSEEDTYSGFEGSIVVTEINTSKNQISGTFNFTVRKVSNPAESLFITDGEFDEVRYTIQ
ncbi:MAG: hypothetical protein JXB49_06820 [Bacteroidales bacterium]|nr:hypothetical protein [Bacteroidales bacterium]